MRLWANPMGTDSIAMDVDALTHIPDVFQLVVDFVGDNQFFFVATVSKQWREAWGCRPKVTAAITGSSTVSQLLDSFEGNLLLRKSGLCGAMASFGNLDLLQWYDRYEMRRLRNPDHKPFEVQGLCSAREQGCHLKKTWCAAACDGAVRGGHLNVLQWLFGGKGFRWHDSTFIRAAEGENLEMIDWLLRNGCPFDENDLCERAARGGHLLVLQYARQWGFPWNELTCASAAKGGHLETLQWAVQHGCRWDEITCAWAALGGKLDVLMWARQHGCPWDTDTCWSAAMEGHLEVLQWARANGCGWHSDTCVAAADGGHLDVLRWAVDSDAPWGRAQWETSLLCNHADVVSWLKATGDPGLHDGPV